MTHSVLVEVRPRLQVCNIFIVTAECLSKDKFVKIDIKVSTVDVIWKSQNGEIVQVINLQDCKLKPLSLSGLQVLKNSISFRIQTEPANSITGSLASEILPFNQNLSIVKNEGMNVPAPNIPTDRQCQIACSCCGNIISKNTFSRLLPLPSSGCLDISDWFCHQHSNSSDFQISSLVQKESDCFYGLCFILLRTSLLNLVTDNVIRCSRCLSWLGTSSNSTSKLWNCTISQGANSISTALEDFKLTITKALKDTFTITSRLVLETRLSEKDAQYLLLWAVDKDLDVLVSSESEKIIRSESNITDSAPVTLVCDLKPMKTMKLLYVYHKSLNDLVKSWQNDHSVQCIEIAKQMLTEGLKYLVNGTELIPDPHKKTNGFFVSYFGL